MTRLPKAEKRCEHCGAYLPTNRTRFCCQRCYSRHRSHAPEWQTAIPRLYKQPAAIPPGAPTMACANCGGPVVNAPAYLAGLFVCRTCFGKDGEE